MRDILDGATIDAGELGYDLDTDTWLSSCGAPGRGLVRRAGTPAPSPPADDRGVKSGRVGMAWRAPRARHRRLAPAGRVSMPDDMYAALGEPRWAAEGFRRSHAEALAAHHVGQRLGASITRYDDVTLEAALLADERVARRLVDHELGPLAEDDERAAKLRTTLDAYLRTGQNASAAAAMLNVNDRTVAYRIRGDRGSTGRSVAARSSELATALRLRRCVMRQWIERAIPPAPGRLRSGAVCVKTVAFRPGCTGYESPRFGPTPQSKRNRPMSRASRDGASRARTGDLLIVAGLEPATS